MGTEFSQLVKSDLENSTLQELLSNEKYIERLRRALPVVVNGKIKSNLLKLCKASRSLPKPCQRAAAPLSVGVAQRCAGIDPRIALSTPPAPRPRDPAAETVTAATITPSENIRVQPLWEVKEEEVALPLELTQSFENWKNNPSAFLQGYSLQDLSTIKDHYYYTQSVEISTASGKILWRFITTLYHDIIAQLCPSGRYNLLKTTLENVVDIICGPVSHGRDEVTKNITKWAKEGIKYRALADKMGGTGCFFFFPNIAESIWRKHLPMSAVDQAAEVLLRLGICKKAQQTGAVDLASRIEEILKKPFIFNEVITPHQSNEFVPYRIPDAFMLSIPRKVPDTAPSIQYAIKGDIEGLQKLFTGRFASPWDVSDTRGFSLVRWALYGGMHNYKTVQFLLDSGASVDEESYQHAWDYAVREKCSTTELVQLRCITTGLCRDWAAEQEFPEVHKIILKRSEKLLRDELEENPGAVHVTDAMGRTALDWATAMAQLSNMRLLIDGGSSVNTMDVSGRTTVLHAVDSHNFDALSMILQAGGNPNPDLPEGRFRSSPLTAATFGGLTEMVKLLIEHDARLESCNPEGRTALLTAASMQNVECVDILVTKGANVGDVSSNGHSPLTTAIMYNNHAMLKLFIGRCETNHLMGFQVPIVAGFADAETMAILASSDPLKQALRNTGMFAAGLDTLRRRTDQNSELSNAFEKLFSVTQGSCLQNVFRV